MELKRYGSPENIYEISKNSPELLEELNVRQIASVRCSGDLQDAQKLLEECYKKKIKIMTMNEEIYPKLARNINDIPILFYYRGNAGLNKYQKSAGVIGARRCMREAKETAIKVVEELVVRKIPVISGMAKGIDSYAHTAALKNGGFTVAVLGDGLD